MELREDPLTLLEPPWCDRLMNQENPISAREIVERLRSRIGWRSKAVESAIEARQVRAWSEAIGDPNPQWSDEAPPTFLFALLPEVLETEMAEATEYGKVWLNGGVRFEYFRPVRTGEHLRVVTRLVEVYEKPGRSGSLLFMITESVFEDESREVVCKIHRTTIRR